MTRLQTLVLMLLLALNLPVQAQTLTDAEHAYLATHTPTLCVDPVWEPYEVINAEGRHEGIAADLHALLRQRLGLTVKLFPSKTWDDSLAASKDGRCQLLSFINQTPARDQWLIFTDVLFTDSNVLITREQFPLITDLSSLRGKTIALPKGTAMHERIKAAYPNLRVIDTVTEEEALGMVSNKQADMSLRGLIVAAYTIKKEGWFNLKINSALAGYENRLRIGVLKSEPMLRDILNKGIATLTEQDHAKIVDQHVKIRMVTDVQIDYTLAKWLTALLFTIVLTSLYWLKHLRMLNRRLQLALAEVTNSEAEQRQFISMLSHEVRSPLAVIDSTAQLLTVTLDDDQAAHPLVARMRRGVARLSNFFDNCLTQDRVDSKNFSLHATHIDVAELANWAIENAELLSEQHHFALELEPDLPPLHGDQTLLRVLLTNLLSNAVKYAPPNTLVTLRFNRRFDSLQIQVTDQGPGIAADELSLIFLRYRRGRNAERLPGAGLGLSVVKRIVDMHRGSVSVVNTPGAGATFTVDLPFVGPASSKMQ